MANDYYTQQSQTQQIPTQNGRHAQQPQYQQPQYPRQMQMQSGDVTTTGQWVLNLFLVAIPIVGLILMFVWAFGSGTAPSKQNWARANLVWLLIAILFSVAIAVVCVVMGVPIQDYLQHYYSLY